MAKIKFEIYGIKEPGTIIHPKYGKINLHEQTDAVLKDIAMNHPHLVRQKEVEAIEKPKPKK